MTGIEWTDMTWNPTTGCDRVSPGRDHCYALSTEQWGGRTPKTGGRILGGRTWDQSPPTLAASTPLVPPGHPPLAVPRSGGGA